MARRLLGYLLAALTALFLLGFIFAVTTRAEPRAVQRWTLWMTDTETGTALVPLLRFTSLDACVAASWRFGLTTGETATCLPYRIGDFR